MKTIIFGVDGTGPGTGAGIVMDIGAYIMTKRKNTDSLKWNWLHRK